MSEPIRSEVEAALALYELWAEERPKLRLIIDAARAWLSTPTEPTDEQIDLARRQLVSYLVDELFLGLEGIVDYDWLARATLETAAGRVQTEEKP